MTTGHRAGLSGVLAVLALACPTVGATPGAAAPGAQLSPASTASASCVAAPALRDDVERRMLPFWAAMVDTRYGGYRVPAPSVEVPDGAKQLVTQARLLWGFARAHRAGFGAGTGAYLAAATTGYRYLLARQRDARHGGFYWTTTADGQPLDRRKILYGQAFVIYALSEYYRASGDTTALDEARRLFEVLNRHARDRAHGGWMEHFEADWRPILDHGYLHVEVAGLKSANTHLHLMEALTELADLSPGPEVRGALAEVMDINTRVFFPSPERTVAAVTPDWRSPHASWWPGAVLRWARETVYGPVVSYGHNVEYAWLSRRAGQVLGRPEAPGLLDAHLQHALAHGFDHQRGGVYDGGYGNRPAHLRGKTWWPQAELLVALTTALDRGPVPAYEAARARLLDWLARQQADPQTGIWREQLEQAGGVASGRLAHHWKVNYHDLRAITVHLASCGALRLNAR